MELIRGLHHIRLAHRDCVATLGNFDGVHIGHVEIIQQLKTQAKKFNLPSLVILFEPQPLEFFRPDQAPARLTSLREKIQHLADLGVDRVLCVKFNSDFSQLTAEDFIQQLLVNKLGVKHLVVGDDFRFGRDRQGDFLSLQQAGQQFEFSVEQSHCVLYAHERVSSTRIRASLANSDFGLVKNLLGRPYSITGRVIYGDALGRQLNFPTANILLKYQRAALSGIFVVTVKIKDDDKVYFGAANVGKRPTVQGTQLRLETYLLDFSGDLYGRTITVEFLHKLREDEKFDGLPALQQAIAEDVENTRKYLKDRF